METAITRWMIVSCKMRFFHPPELDHDSANDSDDDEGPGYTMMEASEPATIHGGGVQQDELVVMTCHLNYATAKSDITDGSN